MACYDTLVFALKNEAFQIRERLGEYMLVTKFQVLLLLVKV